MSHMTWREKRYRRAHLSCVRHITLDPKGPGVVRIHMIPPRTESPEDPFLLLLNGAQLVPLTLSWAVLLANFTDRLEPFSGCEISEEDWAGMVRGAVDETHRTYPRTDRALLQEDLELMLRSLVAIAQGREPDVAVGALTLGEYADKMSAPHRMDLMVSAMTRGGAWHCNQKCLHCYAAGQPMGESRELTTAEWKDVLARLLTPQLCRALAEASLDSVQVTLYAADAEAHNALVGAPGFDETVRGIRNAVDAGLIVSVNTPLCSLNRDYAATLRFAAALGVRYATCSGLIPSGGAEGAESRATRLSAEELTEILQSAVAAAHELSMELDFTSPGWLKEETLRSLGLTLVPSCGACLSNMAVAPDGTVIPCQSWLGGTALGNILTDDWPAIWDGEACRAIRAESAKMEHICQLQTGNRGKEGC